ncbi:polyprotein [Plakobranchus ocellatus]|uniref:Polyprotein n=1 Tax=Plakobranchus ocellatus TaxID=259542 RepID=A0AAV4AIZ1_9GAST|nr:polyprotein [Plakobranchus ocellatus]
MDDNIQSIDNLRDIQPQLKKDGHEARVMPIEIGARGFVGSSAYGLLSKLSICGNKRTKALRLLAETAENGSRWIWSRRNESAKEDNTLQKEVREITLKGSWLLVRGSKFESMSGTKSTFQCSSVSTQHLVGRVVQTGVQDFFVFSLPPQLDGLGGCWTLTRKFELNFCICNIHDHRHARPLIRIRQYAETCLQNRGQDKIGFFSRSEIPKVCSRRLLLMLEELFQTAVSCLALYVKSSEECYTILQDTKACFLDGSWLFVGKQSKVCFAEVNLSLAFLASQNAPQ